MKRTLAVLAVIAFASLCIPVAVHGQNTITGVVLDSLTQEPLQFATVYINGVSFEKNRRQAYYNSSQHFLRSVYENRLEENGYILAMADKRIRLDMIKYNPIDIERYSGVKEDGIMQIHGLKDITYIKDLEKGNACFATNLLYYCGRVGVNGSLFNIPQIYR